MVSSTGKIQVKNLNCRLQVEQVNLMEPAGGPLVLALHSLHFLSASQILFFSYRAATLLMRHHHFDSSCAVCSQEPLVFRNP